MIFSKILQERLKINIEKNARKRELRLHKGSLNGVISVLTRILIYAEKNKHFNKRGFYDGNHILATDIKLLKRNKLANRFISYKLDQNGEYIGDQYPFFERADDSTYHANNSRFGYNGYSHWYLYSDLIRLSVNEAYHYFQLAVNINSKFGTKIDEYAEKLKNVLKKPENLPLEDYLVIKKEKFEFIVNRFIKGIYEGGSILINRLEYVDDEFVYIRNNIESDSRLGGKCRTYTTLSSLKKNVRQYILESYNEIDVNSSVQTIFSNLFYDRKLNLTKFEEEFPQHYKLLIDKKEFRNKIIRNFRISEKEAKELITSVTYSPKSRVIYKYCTLKKFSPKKTKECKKVIEPFIEETIRMREVILNKYYENNPIMKNLIDTDINKANETLNGKGRGKSLDDRRMYRIYEIFEYIIRLSMINFLKSHGNDEIYQIHDCVIFKNNIKNMEFADYVSERTSFSCNFSSKKY